MALRIPFVVGVGVGYVLGARAGRERYESLGRAFRSAKEQPALQEAAGVVAAQATGLVERARQVAFGTPEAGTSGAHGTHGTAARPPGTGSTILGSPPNGQAGY